MHGYEEAKAAFEAMDKSGYVDLQTKAVFIDVNLYCAETETFVFVRLVAEVSDAGFIVTTKDFFFVDCLPFRDGESIFYFCLMCICCVYYVHFSYEAVVELSRTPTMRVRFIMGDKKVNCDNDLPMVTVFDRSLTGDSGCFVYDVFVRAGNVIKDGEALCIITTDGKKELLYSCCAGHVQSVKIKKGQTCRNGLMVLELAADTSAVQAMIRKRSTSPSANATSPSVASQLLLRLAADKSVVTTKDFWRRLCVYSSSNKNIVDVVRS
jgi:hypothetical protein